MQFAIFRQMLREMISTWVTEQHAVAVFSEPRFRQDETGKHLILPALSQGTVRKRYREVAREIVETMGATTIRERAAIQLVRVHKEIERAGTDKNWGAVAMLERLVAQMTGTLEPERVVHTFAAGDALAAIAAGKSDEELLAEGAEEMRRQRELERKARLYEEAIDTVGEPVPPPALPERSSA